MGWNLNMLPGDGNFPFQTFQFSIICEWLSAVDWLLLVLSMAWHTTGNCLLLIWDWDTLKNRGHQLDSPLSVCLIRANPGSGTLLWSSKTSIVYRNLKTSKIPGTDQPGLVPLGFRSTPNPLLPQRDPKLWVRQPHGAGFILQSHSRATPYKWWLAATYLVWPFGLTDRS